LLLTRENRFGIFQAESLRKKSSRVEEENESLMMQVKKMATKARSMMNLIYVFSLLSNFNATKDE
jgi:hypothetical protein